MNNDKALALAAEANIIYVGAGGEAVTICDYGSVINANLTKFAALIQQQMEADGWRQCAEGQGTTQFCGMAEELRKDAERQWVGLTEEEATELWERIDDRDSWELLVQVQAKLKEKNSGHI